MMERQERLQGHLDQLVEREPLLGAAIVSRDGIPVLSSFGPELAHRAFSLLVEGAMVAALMGSAEEGISELGGGDVEHVTVESQDLRLAVVGYSDDLLFLAVGSSQVPADEMLEPVLAAVRTLEEHA